MTTTTQTKPETKRVSKTINIKPQAKVKVTCSPEMSPFEG